MCFWTIWHLTPKSISKVEYLYKSLKYDEIYTICDIFDHSILVNQDLTLDILYQNIDIYSQGRPYADSYP